jgi:WD40 repeat protein
MALSPDRRFAVSVSGQYLAGAEDYTPLASSEPTVKIIDAVTGRVVHSMDMLPSVQCVVFDPSSKYVAAGNLMGDLAVWDVESGRTLAQWRSKSFTSWGIIKSHCYIGGVFAVSFSPDSESLYAAGMGDMRDPMAGNGKQLWQRFDWRAAPVSMKQEAKANQAGEGLMETLAWHPSGGYFAMGGRLRGGKWNLGIFDSISGELIGEAKTGMRITQARYSPDGEVLYLGGMQGQPGPKENRFPDFGYLERYRVISK